ncbi:MAG TPA: hypothetical protein VGM88_17220 [Kofleriaceae bacterium]|jgi:tetratricopeptide (TPR) repeat protein
MTRVAWTCALIGILGGAAIAGPKDPPRHVPPLPPKHVPPLPPKVQEIASKMFEEAAALEAAGKIDEALRKYGELQRLSPHPTINFNIALLLESEDKLSDAISNYEEYLKTSDPADPDRGKVQAHLDELRRSPGHVNMKIESHLGLPALIFVDGALRARDSSTFDVAPGKHKFTVLTEIGYQWRWFRVEPGTSRNNDLSEYADSRDDGNVVLESGPNDESFFYRIDGSDRDDAIGKGVHHDGRYQLASGKHEIQVRSTGCDYDTTIDVTREPLQMFYFDLEGYDEKAYLKHMGRSVPACGHLTTRKVIVRFDAKLPDQPFKGRR